MTRKKKVAREAAKARRTRRTRRTRMILLMGTKMVKVARVRKEREVKVNVVMTPLNGRVTVTTKTISWTQMEKNMREVLSELAAKSPRSTSLVRAAKSGLKSTRNSSRDGCQIVTINSNATALECGIGAKTVSPTNGAISEFKTLLKLFLNKDATWMRTLAKL